jgi:hypothetical protein
LPDEVVKQPSDQELAAKAKEALVMELLIDISDRPTAEYFLSYRHGSAPLT